jgi:hypothetical protein
MRHVARLAAIGLVAIVGVASITAGLTGRLGIPEQAAGPSGGAESSVSATTDGSANATLPSGMSVEALPQTFPAGTEIRVSVSREALPSTVTASPLGQVLTISAASQPARPVLAKVAIPPGTDPSSVIAILWNESDLIPAVLPVSARDGQFVAEVPHFSRFSFVMFPNFSALARWLADTLVDRYLGYLQRAQCSNTTSSRQLRAETPTGRGALVIAVTDGGTDKVNLLLCNTSHHFIAYSIQGDLLGAAGFIPPQGTSPQTLSLATARVGARARVVSEMDSAAWALTVAALFIFAVPAAGPPVVDLLLGHDLNDLYNAVSPAASCLNALRLSRQSADLASGAAGCILQSRAADLLQALILRAAANASLAAIETGTGAIALTTALQEVALGARIGLFLRDVASGETGGRVEYPYVTLADGRAINAALSTSAPTSSPTALVGGSVAPRPTSPFQAPSPTVTPTSQRPTAAPSPSARPLVPGPQASCGSGSQNGQPLAVAFYVDINYTGTCVWLSVGDWDDLARWGIDAKVRSIDNRLGYHITLFDQANFGGTPGYFDQSVPLLPGDWLDRARSARVERNNLAQTPPPAAQSPAVQPTSPPVVGPPSGTVSPSTTVPLATRPPSLDVVINGLRCPQVVQVGWMVTCGPSFVAQAGATYSWSAPGASPSTGGGGYYGAQIGPMSYGAAGTFTITLRACDATGCATQSQQISVVP